MKTDLKIDLVYLWVNGNDPQWIQDKETWQTKLRICDKSTNNCRFIDNQELRYSLRSIEMNAPWINKIFIVTNGQIPEWLDIAHPKIKIVTHKEIMPAEALPTFNSEAIETCIANIPGLSEYFLYANDDCFINRPVKPSFFFNNDGQPVVRLVRQNWQPEEIEQKLYLKNVTFSINLIKKHYGVEYKFETVHNIDAYKKSYLIQCKQEFQKEFENTCYCKFRTKNSVQRTIYSFWMLANRLALFKECGRKNKDALYLTLGKPNQMAETIKSRNPYLLCINDEEQTSPVNRKKLRNFLAELYPCKQIWEKEQNFLIEPKYNSPQAKAIVFAPDNNYSKYFGVALQSLIDNSKNYEDYDIIVFDSDITERNKQILIGMLPPNFSLRFFDINTFISEKFAHIQLKEMQYWSTSMYYRIFIPIVMKKYKKVLYCDVDICFNNSISELFDIEFGDKELLSVIDTASPVLHLYESRMQHICGELKVQNPDKYFNSGILMFNNEKIETNNYINKFKEILETKILLFPDQDILNILFDGKAKIISCKYNYQYGVKIFNQNYINIIFGDYKKDFIESGRNPVIIHYTSSRKPWHSPKEELANVFWYYARRSPFYEEILYTHLKGKNISEETLKNLNLKGKIYYNYYRAKLLSFLTFGKRRKHYQDKRDQYKKRVRDIRKFSRL